MKNSNVKKAVFVLMMAALCCALSAQAALTKYDDMMFWRLDGTDYTGKPSKVYVLGTIHIADERLYPIPEPVAKALAQSDRYCSEVSTEGWMTMQNVLQDASMGYDVFLTNQFMSSGIEIEGLEDVAVQYEIFRIGGWDAQLARLKDAINLYLEKDLDPAASFQMLYNAYLSGNENFFATVSKAVQDVEIRKCSALENEYDYMFGTRNPVWADEINDYLTKGGTTFIYAGAGHFTGKDSVFDVMKERGYIAE